MTKIKTLFKFKILCLYVVIVLTLGLVIQSEQTVADVGKSVATTIDASYIKPEDNNLTLDQKAENAGYDADKDQIYKLTLQVSAKKGFAYAPNSHNVVFVFDRSGSMNNAFGSSTFALPAELIPPQSEPTQSEPMWETGFMSDLENTNEVPSSALTQDMLLSANQAGTPLKVNAMHDYVVRFVEKMHKDSPYSFLGLISVGGKNIANNFTPDAVNEVGVNFTDPGTYMILTSGASTWFTNLIDRFTSNWLDGSKWPDGGLYPALGFDMSVNAFRYVAALTSGRSRVVIYITDGSPGIYGFSQEQGLKDTKKWADDAAKAAADTIAKANFLKSTKNTSYDSTFSFTFQGPVLDATGKNTGANSYQATYTSKLSGNGAGATIYSIGLFDQPFYSKYQSSIDEYMERLSGRDGVSDPSGPAYYQVVNSAEGLSVVLDELYDHLFLKSGLTIRNYIDDRFLVVDAAGTPLKNGDAVAVPGKEAGVLHIENGLTWVEWSIGRLAPPGLLDPGVSFSTQFYAKPHRGSKLDATGTAYWFDGGNSVPITLPGPSAVFCRDPAGGAEQKLGSFPIPLVPVPLTPVQITNISDTVYAGSPITKDAADVITTMGLSPNTSLTWKNGAPSNSFLTADSTVYPFVVTLGAPIYRPGSAILGACPVRELGKDNDVKAQIKEGTYTVQVLKPYVELSDIAIFYGEDIDPNASVIQVGWKLSGAEPTAQELLSAGPVPGLTWILINQETGQLLDGDRLWPSKSTDYTVKISRKDVPDFSLNDLTTYANKSRPQSSGLGRGNFSIAVSSGNLTIHNTCIGYTGAPGNGVKFVYRLEYTPLNANFPGGKRTFYEVLEPNESRRITGLPCGKYEVFQESWITEYQLKEPINKLLIIERTSPLAQVAFTLKKVPVGYTTGSTGVKNVFR